MAELLLELFSEEIPARMQARAAADLNKLVTDKLKGAGLAFSHAQAFVTPRRLVVLVDGLPLAQPDLREEKKGPRVGSPDKAIEGFLKGAGLTSLDQCEKRGGDKGEFWFAVIERKGRPSAVALPELLGAAIAELPWPKSMRWGDHAIRWVRPLHSILCLFDGAVLPVRFGHLQAGNGSRGHRFMGGASFTAHNFATYREALRAAYVLLDPVERREQIARDLELAAENEGLSLVDDPALLDEVTGLVEWPVILMGTIDQAFMDVPREVLTTTMRTNQKYFSLNLPNGEMAPRFLLAANMLAEDGGERIIDGNERVLRARLSDAKFFWDQDRKVTLESRVAALEQIVFHAKLGTVAEKSARVIDLVATIATAIGANADEARRAARLAKADLTSGMVGEFPELQGIMGRYYARHDGETAAVAEAIADHYSPLGPNDRCPTAPVSVALALADKIDILVNFFAIDEKPTGSKDPFALRRAALGVIRLILENRLRLSLRDIFMAVQVPDNGKDRGQTARELLDFFADRLKVFLRERGVRHDLITAVFALGGEDDLVRLLTRVEAVQQFLATDDGANLLAAYRRAANIVRIEEKKDGQVVTGAVDQSLLQAAEEQALQARLIEVETLAAAALGKEQYAVSCEALARLRKPLDAFFEVVTVNVDDRPLRANRLKLLAAIRQSLDRIADFSKIEG